MRGGGQRREGRGGVTLITRAHMSTTLLPASVFQRMIPLVSVIVSEDSQVQTQQGLRPVKKCSQGCHVSFP